MVESHNAGMPRLNHSNFHSGMQTHFSQAANQLALSANFQDRPGFPGLQQVHRKDVRHANLRVYEQIKTETESQYGLFYQIPSSFEVPNRTKVRGILENARSSEELEVQPWRSAGLQPAQFTTAFPSYRRYCAPGG
jgi:hypothetical protein